jgi:Bacterial Ig-like domain
MISYVYMNIFIYIATVICSFDAGVGEGTYSLTAQATNGAGNTATSTAPVTFTVDRTRPTVVINSAIDGNGNPVPDRCSTSLLQSHSHLQLQITLADLE